MTRWSWTLRRPAGSPGSLTRRRALAPDQLQAAADGSLDIGELAVGLKAAGLEDSGTLATYLAAELAEQARTGAGQQVQLRRLDAVRQPRYELPMITDGMDLGGLYRLAAALREQGAA